MTRPLPELTVQNEFFWTAGGDGVLRIQQCQDCAALIHPPQPVCRYCRSRKMGVRDVSGKATLSAFTVNHRFGFPDLPPPYVVSQVAVVEDPRVRLTTNIVECDPDELQLGQTVEVVFEKIEDVWLPLFRPAADKTTGPQPADEIAPQDFGRYVRPPLTREKFEEHSAITGIGASRLGRRRRTDARRHRRSVDLPGTGRRWHGGRRRVCARGGARDASDVDQRRYGHVRSRRLGHCGDDGHRDGDGQARAVLPNALGGNVSTADEGGEDVPAGWCPYRQLAGALRRDVGGSHPGAQRATPLRPVRHHAGDARLDRGEPARQRGP